LALVGVATSTTTSGATPQPKVSLCHRTSSVRNPYNLQTVNANSIVRPDGEPTGHAEHTGPVFPAEDWGDIIPPFLYTNDSGGTSQYPGLNWTHDGVAIYEGGCRVHLIERPPDETTTTTVPQTTTTTVPQTTTTTVQVTTTTVPVTTTTTLPVTTTTTRPGSTTSLPATTTTIPETTTTMAETTTTQPNPPTTAPPSVVPPGPTDPPGGIEIVPPTEAVTVDPGDQLVTLGSLDAPERVVLESEIDSELAYTGQNLGLVVGLGIVLAAAGAGIVLGTRPRRRRVR
jgi:hypothetical protein